MTIQKLNSGADAAAVLDGARNRSEQILETLRSVAANLLGENSDLIIGVNGSVARREVTSGSDVDLFVLTLSGDLAAANAVQKEYRERLVARNIKMPAHGGVFESPLWTTQLTATIGGEDDTNTFITRRMLYLLEGEWVANEDGFNRLRSDLVARYVSEDLDDQKIVRFFLNDVIRYWRTICVDFENKTADATKPRAIRLVKLRLSRMLLYVAGIAAARQTVDCDAATKRERLAELLALPPLERLRCIHGLEKMVPVQALYATFLLALDRAEIRSQLELPGAEGLSTPEFKGLTEVARDFKVELLGLLDMNAGGDPLMEALLL
jgi:predicted nucleotidyltransferase